MRYRLRWAKRGKLRFLSHHDVATVLERSFRRAKLPISYTQGFSAHPKIAFGSGLPVGYGSDVELLDLELDLDIDPRELCERLEASLPEGLHALEATRLTIKGRSLGETIVAADYEVDCAAPWLAEALDSFMSRDVYEFSRPYKGAMRVDNLRAGVVEAKAGPGGITMRCILQPRATRPADVIQALSAIAEVDEAPPIRVRRLDLLSMVDGELRSLLLLHELGAAS
jgi:radical SAM-linked protein